MWVLKAIGIGILGIMVVCLALTIFPGAGPVLTGLVLWGLWAAKGRDRKMADRPLGGKIDT